MNRLQIKAQILQQVGNDNYFANDCDSLINRAIEILSSDSRNTSNRLDLNSVAGQLEYTLPMNVMEVKEVVYNGGKPLTSISKEHADYILAQSLGQPTILGIPSSFYTSDLTESAASVPTPGQDPSAPLVVLSQKILGIVPKPQEIAKINLTFVRRAKLLVFDTDAPDFPEEHHMSIVDWVLQRLKLKDRMPESLEQAREYGRLAREERFSMQVRQKDKPSYIRIVDESAI